MHIFLNLQTGATAPHGGCNESVIMRLVKVLAMYLACFRKEYGSILVKRSIDTIEWIGFRRVIIQGGYTCIQSG